MHFAGGYVQRYGCAIVAVAIAIWVQHLLDPVLGLAFPYATVFLAIALAARYGGLGPALSAVMLGAVSVPYFLLPPRGVFIPEGLDQQVALLLYVSVGVGIALLGGAMDSARRTAQALSALPKYPASQMDQAERDELAPGHPGQVEAALSKTNEELQARINSCTVELAQSRESLQLHEHQLCLLIEAVKDTALLILDPAGNIVSWNAGAKRILGYEAEEIIGQNISRFYSAKDAAGDLPKRDMEVALMEGRHEQECRRVPKGGSPFWAMVVTTATFDAQGRHIGFASVTRDITERKNTAEIARKRVELLRFFIRRAPASVAMLDIRMRYVAVSQRWLEDYGLAGQSLEGRSHYDVFPALPEHWKEIYRRCLAGVFERAREDPLPRADGSVRWMRCEVRPWYAKLGVTIGGIIIFSEDITSRKEAEIQLRASEARYRQVVDLSLECIWIVSDGRIAFANKQVARLLGCDRPDELIGRQYLDFVQPDDRDRAADILERLSQIGESIPLEELRFIDERDRIITLEIQAVCLEYDGRPAVMVVARDVSERRSLESELLHAQKMEAIGQLTGGIAHDFNNILTVITGSIEILADAVANRPEIARVAKIVEEAAWRGADTTQRLLAFARRQPLQPRETDINALIVDTAKLLRATLGEQIEIESMLEDDLRSALVDPSQLTAALINLALNARDAMPDGGKLVIETDHVYLDEIYAKSNREVRPGPYVMIALSDTGSGMSPTILGKVFEPFFTTKQIGRGTGLGLSMVYGFVKQSEGHIKIYSEEGHGTTIKLYLPQADRIAQLAVAPPILPAEGGTESILVVEDDSMVRDYVAAQLGSLGYEVLTAGNATEALAVIERVTDLDLLFTDVIMPGAMNGRLLADEAQRRRPTMKVLFTSGYTENAIIHHGRLDPGVLLLSKPYRKSDLARLVREAIGQPLR
jgi:PAS domain S-box-containing protein